MNNKEIIAKLDESEVTSYDDRQLHEFYDAMLDECYPECKIAGLNYSTGDALKIVDPTAYRCGFNDWLDSECQDERLIEVGDRYYDFDEAQKVLDAEDE